jgi:peroxidase
MKEQEQKAFVNTFLSGYDQVRIVKSAADAACGTTLSYADTIVAGGFTGVYLSGGPNATQYVRFGRVDTAGLDDPSRLPSAFTINDVLISIFAGLGLNVEELVALSGAHTLGKATCANVTPRIAADPYADPPSCTASRTSAGRCCNSCRWTSRPLCSTTATTR